ncbi:MAG: hypothetical protein K2K80_05830 [Clostridia bacterium]|nr:hypothetical protein [Clostridia bacterium]
MKKSNINGKISYNQYKLMDILLFLVIMCVFETINVFAIKKWFTDMLFSVSLMTTISLIVLVRWNLLGAIFPVVNGVLYSILLGAPAETYVIYAVGNAFIALSWFVFKLLPKEKLFAKWYLTLIYPAVAFVILIFARTAVAVCFGNDFVACLGSNVFAESLNTAFAAVALLVLRKLPGMLEDQKLYLKRVAQSQEIKPPKDEVWAGYTELDEEELKKLHGTGEKEEKGDGISLYDEYPPDSR